jgi:hypothetical protein
MCGCVQALTGDVRARDYAQLMDDVVSDWCKEICGTKQPAMLAQVRLVCVCVCVCVCVFDGGFLLFQRIQACGACSCE